MKRKVRAGITSVSLPVIVYDNTSTTGAGLSGLTHTTSGLILEYRRQGQSSWTQLGVGTGLVAKTLGTYTSGGIVASGGRAGRYEIDVPDAAFAAGARMVEICLRGAANMHPVDIEIELDAVDYQDANAFGLSRLAAAGTAGSVGTGVTLSAVGVQAIWDALTTGLSTANSIGKWILDNLNASISSRASQSSVDGKPTLTQIEASTVLAKEATVSGRPTLTQIEASTVLAKESTVSSRASQTSVDGKPTLAQIEGSSILSKETTSASILTAIQNLNNLSAKVNIFGSPLLEIPDAGSTDYAFTVIVKDDEDKLVALDGSPTVTAANAAGTNRSGNLSVVSNPSTGRYTFTYSVASTHPAESLRIAVSGTVSGEARYIEWIGAVVNYDTLTVLQQISTDLAGKPNLAQIEASTILAKEVTVSSRASQASVDGKPTLGQIEASTVLAKEQSVSSLIDRIGAFTGSGANTVLGFFRALMRKDAGAPTPSDVGGTFSNTTDSLEAIRDRGDAAWTTGAGGGGGGGGDPWATNLQAGNYTANQAGGILQTIVAKTNTIQSGKVAYAGPVTAKGTVDLIVIGDDYLTAHGTAFVWTIPAIPGMSAADVTVHFGGRNGVNTFAVTGTAADIGSGKWSLTVEMPRASSGQLVVGEYRYSVAVHNAAGVELTKIYYDDPFVAVEKFTP